VTAANPDGVPATDPAHSANDLTRWDEPASLAGLVDRASVDQLLALLGDPDPAMRWQAGEALAQTASRLRKHALRASVSPIAASPDYGFTELLARMAAGLSSPDALLRTATADALGLWDHEAAVNLLESALQDADYQVRASVVRALGHIGDPGSLESLTAALADPSVWVRRSAADALGNLRANAAVGPLENALSDPQPLVRSAAASALGHIRSARARAVLERTTRSSDAELRWYAARSLGQIGDRASCAALSELCREEGVLLFGQSTRDVATEAIAATEARDRGLINRLRRVLYALILFVRRARQPATDDPSAA